ncbi:MAG TPA: type II secretion system protein GspC, partial [Burkholderiales bacterium]|nr:type II secretion system protein GspC [Burkholderiales bacterium]
STAARRLLWSEWSRQSIMANERTQRFVRMAVVLVTLLLTAMLSARGATQLLASKVLPVTPQSANKVPPVRVASAGGDRTQTPRELGEAVLRRNIFDSQTGPIDWAAPAPVAEATPAGPDNTVADPDGEPAFCPPGMRLIAAVVHPTHPEQSLVTIEANGKQLLYRPGADVAGHALVGIREHRVFLRPTGKQLCQLAMFVPPQPMAEAPPPPPPPPPPTSDERPPAFKSSLSEEELNQGISQVSDTRYTINRQLLDKVLGNQAELMRAARVVPYEENGRVVGVKVYGIRRTALLGKLGIQNGDVLRTINGFDLSSPDSALEAYAKLRETSEFSIAMMRRGTPRTMEYSVK